jgi:hypothetical protein
MFKEQGVSIGVAQKHNAALIQRRQLLAEAWQAYGANASSDDNIFTEGWVMAGVAALKKPAKDAVFE